MMRSYFPAGFRSCSEYLQLYLIFPWGTGNFLPACTHASSSISTVSMTPLFFEQALNLTILFRHRCPVYYLFQSYFRWPSRSPCAQYTCVSAYFHGTVILVNGKLFKLKICV